MKMFKWLFGKKKKELDFPEEFVIITYNKMALRNGIEDFHNKIIERYKYNYRTGKVELYRTYGYSESMVYNLRHKLKIPIHDKTEKEIKYPLHSEIMLDDVSYNKG